MQIFAKLQLSGSLPAANFSISSVLTECTGGSTFYTAMHLENLYDLAQLQKELDKLNIKSKISELTKDVSNIRIEPAAENELAMLLNIFRGMTFNKFTKDPTV